MSLNLGGEGLKRGCGLGGAVGEGRVSSRALASAVEAGDADDGPLVRCGGSVEVRRLTTSGVDVDPSACRDVVVVPNGSNVDERRGPPLVELAPSSGAGR